MKVNFDSTLSLIIFTESHQNHQEFNWLQIYGNFAEEQPE